MHEPQRLSPRQQRVARSAQLIGILNQLITARAVRQLEGSGLSFAQFTVLNHFSNAPERRWTLTRLASVMDLHQPTATKLTQALITKGYLAAEADKNDARIKHLALTKAGLVAHQVALRRLAPAIMDGFEALDDETLAALCTLLERLKVPFDENRPPPRTRSKT